MAFPSLENALNRVSNRYLLVVLAAKRARQLNRGAPPRVDTRYRKPSSLSLEEVGAGKVEYRMKDESETAKL
jgi:DNA-directed RNA polymerase subunit omega